MSSTSASGMLAAGARPADEANSTQAQRPASRPSGTPISHGDPGQAECLPLHHAQHLAPHQAEGLEHGQVTAPPPHRRDEHVGERGHGEQGQDAAEDQGGVPDPGVVADLVRALITDHHARSERASRPGGDRRQPGRRGRQVSAGAVAQQREAVARPGPGAAGLAFGLGQHRGGQHSAGPQVGGLEAAPAEGSEHRGAGDEHRARRPVHLDRDPLSYPEVQAPQGLCAQGDFVRAGGRPASQQREEVPAAHRGDADGGHDRALHGDVTVVADRVAGQARLPDQDVRQQRPGHAPEAQVQFLLPALPVQAAQCAAGPQLLAGGQVLVDHGGVWLGRVGELAVQHLQPVASASH